MTFIESFFIAKFAVNYAVWWSGFKCRTVNANDATDLGSILAFSDTVVAVGREI
jgi:hypothetical protein